MEKIKFTVGAGITGNSFLESERFKGLKINPTAGYWLGRLKGKLEPIVKGFIAENNKLVVELGEEIKTDDGKIIEGSFRVKPEKSHVYNKSLEDLQNQTEEIDFKPMKYSLFDDKNPDNKGYDILPAEFWTSIGVYFVEEPDKK